MQVSSRIAAMSSYLAFRYVVYPDAEFSENVAPVPLNQYTYETHQVFQSSDIDRIIQEVLGKCDWNSTGILLSGGIDSAILAAYVPRGTKAYTIRFIAENAIDESLASIQYADKYHLDLHIVDVSFQDYLNVAPLLMKARKCPLHQIECAVYRAASVAKSQGINALVMGNGADYLFGGLDKLLSREWSFDELVNRYTIVQPKDALKQYHPIEDAYEPFRIGENGIDLLGFLKDVHGICSIPSFANPLKVAGIKPIEPYEHMELGVPLDLNRIRQGESKYLIRELFSSKYPEFAIPDKIAFARPMDQWLCDYTSPSRSEFIRNCAKNMTGDQKWLVFCLEWFLNLIDSGEIA